MDFSLLANFKNRGDLELNSIEKPQSQYLYNDEVTDHNLEFYKYFSSNITPDESNFYNYENEESYDNVSIVDGGLTSSIYMTRLDHFNQLNIFNHNDKSTGPHCVQDKHGLSYGVNGANVPLLESTCHSQNGHDYEKNIYGESCCSEIEVSWRLYVIVITVNFSFTMNVSSLHFSPIFQDVFNLFVIAAKLQSQYV